METLEQLVSILASGATIWNAFVNKKRAENPYWRADLTDADLTDADLTGANLTRANLTRANLTGANLTRANLTGATLTGADLTGANLTGANLTRANLTGATLTRADLTDANLTDANLTRANLTRADLTGANLTGATLTGATLTDANLTGANLTGANLTAIKADFLMKMMQLPFEVEGLRQFVIGGKINGSSYEGECACFVGSMEKLAREHHIACPLARIADSPTEKFFMGIQPGDTPENNAASKMVLSWIDEFLAFVRLIKNKAKYEDAVKND